MKKNRSSDIAVTTRAEIDALLHEARAQYRVNCQDTLQLAQLAVEAAERIGYAEGGAQADYLIGKAQLILNDADTALPRLRSASRQAKALNLVQLGAEIFVSLATAQQMQGQYHAPTDADNSAKSSPGSHQEG